MNILNGKSLSRRAFFRQLLITVPSITLGATVPCAAQSVESGQASVPPEDGPAYPQQGYQETEHVHTYYKVARF